MSDQNNLLMTKLFSNDQVQPMTNILTSLIGNWKQNSDPFELLSKAKQLFGNENTGNETPEMLRTKFDAQLALLHEQLLIEEKKHEWSAESDEKKTAAASGDKLLETVSQVAEKTLGPAINNLSQGYAQGLLAKQQQQQQMQSDMEQQQINQRRAQIQQEQARRMQAAQREVQEEQNRSRRYQNQENMPRGAPAPGNVNQYNPNPYAMNQNQYNEKQFFNLSDEQLSVLESEYNRRAIDMESFGNTLRAAKAQRKLMSRQQTEMTNPEPAQDINSMGSAVGAQAPARIQGRMDFNPGNASNVRDETGTNTGPVPLDSEDDEEELENEADMETDEVDATELAANMEEGEEEGSEDDEEPDEQLATGKGMNFGVAVNPEQNSSDEAQREHNK